MRKNIIIVGYPKSGTTWISRLVAELVGCELQGNWGFDNTDEPIKEGEERISEYVCYKSHHSFDDIFEANDEDIYKIIYVIRDPRDLVISSLYYFRITYPKIRNILLKIPLGRGIYKIIEKNINFIKNKNSKKKRMINMVLYGDKTVTEWSELSWKEHYRPYFNENVLFVSYERMLLNPYSECLSILEELNIVKSKDHILNSIESQSFYNKRKTNEKKQNIVNSNLLREGKFGYWKTEFDSEEKLLFIKKLKKDLSKFNYKID